jgi:elongation of very long chain fatty acids protein 6
MLGHPETPIIACVLYGIAIIAGQRYFRDRPAWNCRTALALWNFTLSAFSFMGVVRVLPALVHIYSRYNWKDNFCLDPESHYGTGASGLWIYFFILSKFP